MIMRIMTVTILFASCVAAGPVAAQQSQPDTLRPESPPPSSVQNYLEPGDVIRLRIWREENMSDDFTVDADGIVVFPRLGPRQVTGKNPSTLKDELVVEYGRLLRTPSVEVTFLRRINVGGAVQRPGVYHVDPTMSVRDVLLEAGGATSSGRTDQVELIRDGEVIQARLRQDQAIVESPVRSGDQLFIPERNWAARNIGAVVGIGGALLSFTATMIILAASN
jgi:polysaccharide export outer membrane protein